MLHWWIGVLQSVDMGTALDPVNLYFDSCVFVGMVIGILSTVASFIYMSFSNDEHSWVLLPAALMLTIFLPFILFLIPIWGPIYAVILIRRRVQDNRWRANRKKGMSKYA